MPIPTQIDNNFTGRAIDGIIVKTYQNLDFVKDYGVKVLQSIKSKFILTGITGEVIPERRVDCPSSEGAVMDIKEYQWSVGEYMVRFGIKEKALVGTIREKFEKQGVNNGSIMDDPELMAAIWLNINKKLQNRISEALFMGDESIAHPYPNGQLDIKDGWVKLFQTDPLINDVPAPTLANLSVYDPSVPNVLTEIEKVVDAIPRNVRYGDTTNPVKIAVSLAIYQTYQKLLSRSLINNGYYTTVTPPNPGVIMMGEDKFQLVKAFYLPDNMMFATLPDNLFVGVDSENDVNEIQVINKREVSTCRGYDVRIDYNLVPGYGNADEITFYEAL
jgi:hypothetical protein